MQKSTESEILKVMEERKISLAALGRSTHVSKEHIFYVLKGKPGEKRNLSQALLSRINEVLDTEFTLSGSQTSDDIPAEDSSRK